MADRLIPMRDLRALAKRAGFAVSEWPSMTTRTPGRGHHVSRIVIHEAPGIEALDVEESLIKGRGSTKRAAQIQARNNAKKFLDCALTMEYGEGE